MSKYRVYFFGAGDHIIQARNFAAMDDAEAITTADALCQEVPACVAVEIWQGFRKLHRQARAA